MVIYCIPFENGMAAVSGEQFLRASQRYRFSDKSEKEKETSYDLQPHISKVPDGYNPANVSQTPEPLCQAPISSPWPDELLVLG